MLTLVQVMGQVNGSLIKRNLLKMAINSKLAEMKRGILRKNTIWDALVFRKVQEGMGGRIRLLVVGSAPLSGNVLTFIRCALGCVVSPHLLIWSHTFRPITAA